MYTIKEIEVNSHLKNKYQVHSYQQLENLLLEKIHSVQMIENSHAKCKLLLDLANIYLHSNKRIQVLELLEQADALIIEYAYNEFLSEVYLLRAHLAFLHNDWILIDDLCEQGITAASKFKQYDRISCFYLIWTQMALNDGLYDKAILFGKLVLHFAGKHKGGMPNFSISVSVFLLQAYIALQKNEEAYQILSKLASKKNLTPVEKTYATIANTLYAWVNTEIVEYEEQLHDELQQLWQMGQFAEVKTIVSFMLKYSPVLYATYAQSSVYTHALQLDEEMIRFLEKLDYHDQIRGVQTTSYDEKTGYQTGKRFRELLQEKIDTATEEQFITIATFVIQVNDSDLLDRYLKIKYDYYVKIIRNLSQFYPKSTKGKYYPSSFCAMFITDEPLDIQAVCNKCKDYLDTIELELEGQPIYYRIHIGASSVQKRELKSLQSLYQEADQSLYYAKVTKQPLIVYGKEG